MFFLLLAMAVDGQPNPPPPPGDPGSVPIPGIAWLAVAGAGLGFRYFFKKKKTD